MKKWTDYEISFLLKNYGKKGPSYCGNELKRSKNSVSFKAKTLNLSYDFFYSWTDEEIDFLKLNYSKKGPKYCAEILGKKEIATQDKGRALGLSKKIIKWSQEEIEFLKTNYKDYNTKKLIENLNRSEESIFKMAQRLNLTYNEFRWTDEEITFLRENFKLKGADFCAEHLKRTRWAIVLKTKLIGENNIQHRAWRNVLAKHIKRKNIIKKDSTYKLLGYTYIQLKHRIECQFKPGMSWDNYGKWHIDHKKPISKFKKEASIKMVNSLCNLQPMWAKENLNKGSKLIYFK